MSVIVQLIIIFFVARIAFRFFFGLGRSRNVDDVLPWLRVGKRWRAHHILPFLIFVPFVVLIEGRIFSEDRWPNFGTHIPRFEVRAPSEEKTTSTLPLALFPAQKPNAADYLKRLAEQRAQEERDSAPTRQLSTVLSAEDRASLGDLPPIRISQNAQRIDVFSVREDQTARDANIARGWLARLTTGYQSAEYQVTTHCGFDISAQPAERVCFSAIPAPIFLKTTHTDCIEGAPNPSTKRVFVKDRSLVTTQDTYKCDYAVNMPWVLLRMDRSGVRAINCVFDTLRRETAPCDNGTLVLSLAGANQNGVVEWSQYTATPESVTLRLGPRPDTKGEATAVAQWSQRHITRDHASIIPALNPQPIPVETIEHDVPLPAAHLTAMRFLGAPIPLSQRDRELQARLRIKNVVAIGHLATQIRASYPKVCRDLIGPRQTQLQIAVARQASAQATPPLPISSLQIRFEPRKVSIGGTRCPNALPILLSDLY